MNQRYTLVLLGVFALVLGVFLVARQMEKKKQAEATPTPSSYQTLWPNMTKDDVAKVRLSDNVTGESVVLENQQGNWSVVLPLAQPAIPSDSVSIASQLATLYVPRTLTETTDLSAFGVLTPAYTFEVTKNDGTILTVDIGAKTSVGSDYYALRRGEANAILVDGYAIDALLPYIKDPPYLATATPEATVTETPEATVTETPEASSTPAP